MRMCHSVNRNSNMDQNRGEAWLAHSLGVFVLLAAISGCGGGPVQPDHLPPLTPLSITVTHNGSPVADASVLMSPETGKYAASGITDAYGKAVMKTDSQFEGVIAGSFLVTVTKKEKLDVDYGASPSSPAEMAAYQAKVKSAPKPKHLLPEKYSSFGKSGLKIEVVEGSPATETIDLKD